MTAQGFRDALAKLGINQVQAARALRVDPRTVRRWIAGDVKIPGPVEILLETWLKTGMPRDIRSKL